LITYKFLFKEKHINLSEHDALLESPSSGTITFIRYALSRKISKPNNLKILKSSKTKGPQNIVLFYYQTPTRRDLNVVAREWSMPTPLHVIENL